MDIATTDVNGAHIQAESAHRKIYVKPLNAAWP